MDLNTDYYKGLIKGKITESIFEEMFKVSENFTILQMGYEHTLPQLAQYQNHIQIKQVLENIRHAPDFVLISENKEHVFLVEVKFRHTINNTEILKYAEEINQRWQPCFLFIATPSKFYLDSCTRIISNQGEINELSEHWISKNKQQQFIKILNEFIL